MADKKSALNPINAQMTAIFPTIIDFCTMVSV
jgi:hypothetical protein